MKLASHHWMRPEPIEKTFARLARCGYDAIELSGEPYKYTVAEIRSLMEKYKIQCWGGVTIMVGDRDLVREDGEIRRKSVKYVIDTIDLVAGCGGSILTIVPATVGRITSKASPEEEWRWAVEGLREIRRHARDRKVTMGIEPLNRFETNFINNHKQALLLAKETGDDVGVCLDGFHINIEEHDPVAAIRAVGSKLTDFHVADSNRRPPGEGHNNWNAIFRAIRETGYRGCLTNEVVVPFDRTPVTRTRSDAAAIEGASAEDLKFIADHGTDVLTDEEFERNVRATADYVKNWHRKNPG